MGSVLLGASPALMGLAADVSNRGTELFKACFNSFQCTFLFSSTKFIGRRVEDRIASASSLFGET